MEKLQCKKCLKVKEAINFSLGRGKRGYHVWCKSCVKEYDTKRYQKSKYKILQQNKEYRQKTRAWYISYKKTLKCEKCGDTRWYVLTFNHKGDKLFDVSNYRHFHSLVKLKEEIKKCEVLCANCHLELHHFQLEA